MKKPIVLIVYCMLLFIATYSQTPMEAYNISSLPDDITIDESNEVITETYFYLSDTDDKNDLTPLDIHYMTPYTERAVYVYGSTISDTSVMVKHIPNLNEYFPETSFQYSTAVHEGDYVEFYDINGNLLNTYETYGEPSLEDISLPIEADDIIVNNGFSYEDTGLKMDYIDDLKMFITENKSTDGSWQSIEVTKYEDDLSQVLFENTVYRETTPSGLCLFRVQFKTYNSVEVSQSGELRSQIESKPDFKVFPNPATEFLSIKIPSQISSEGYSITIYGIDGKVIDKIFPNENLTTVEYNCSRLTNGAHIIMISDGQNYYSKTFIKQ